MLRYSDYDLVNVIIHETVHATVYIKNAVDFNERLATYIGNKGTELFYLAKEGKNSPTHKRAVEIRHDDQLFSDFIGSAVKDMKAWYKESPRPLNEKLRESKFAELQRRFEKEVIPDMKTPQYSWFPKVKLNNARLLSYNTYYTDLSDFEAAYNKLGQSFERLIAFAKELENHDSPEQALKDFAQNSEN